MLFLPPFTTPTHCCCWYFGLRDKKVEEIHFLADQRSQAHLLPLRLSVVCTTYCLIFLYQQHNKYRQGSGQCRRSPDRIESCFIVFLLIKFLTRSRIRDYCSEMLYLHLLPTVLYSLRAAFATPEYCLEC